MTDLVQHVFNEISLERDPKMWHNSKQGHEMTRKRINFLAEFEETLFRKNLNVENIPTCKNDILAQSFLMKSSKAEDTQQKIKLLNSALLFATDEKSKEILNKRTELTGNNKLVNLKPMTEDDIKKFHPTLKNFSKKIRVKNEPGRGRFLVADEDIMPGEQIARERSFAMVLDRSFINTHCDNCSRPVSPLSLMGCPECSLARYCCEDCQKTALSSHHKYECLVQDTLYKGGTGAWILAYRIVCSKDLSYWTSLKKKFNNHNEDLGVGEEVYDSDDVMTVFNLVMHESAAREAPILMKECLTALFFLRCLQVKKYFGENYSAKAGNLSEDEMFIAMLLHHFMRVVYYNCHELTELQPGSHWSENKIVKIGIAINPSLALINHSCDSNYARVMSGRRVKAFATRTIKAGEEILDVYCGTFAVSEADQRCQVHARYNFCCQCPACMNAWPTLTLLAKNVSKAHINKISDNSVKQIDKSYKQLTSSDWRKKTSSKDAHDFLVNLLVNNELKHPHFLKYQAEVTWELNTFQIFFDCYRIFSSKACGMCMAMLASDCGAPGDSLCPVP